MPSTSTSTWGASASDWDHFARTLGLESDLLPVVSNPHAIISARSKLRDLGKVPSRYDASGEAVGIPGWTNHIATDRDIGRWSRNSDHGICLQTRQVRAIDIDIADPARAAAVLSAIEMVAGTLPARTRPGTGKALLLFTMPGEFSKRVIRTPDGIIEFLATGQQCVVVGTHPSGTRYEWAQGLPTHIPELTPAEFDALWQGLAGMFALDPSEAVTARAGVMPAVPRRKTDSFDPVVDFLQENGHVLEFDRDGRVHVRCPWESEHTSDSGPTATSWFPAGVGGFAQGHFKCLHAHCSGRTDGDFLNAIGYAASDFDVVDTAPVGTTGDGTFAMGPASPDVGGVSPGVEPEPWPVFVRDSKGKIEPTADNASKALQRPDICGARVAYDEFKDTIMLGWVVEGEDKANTWRPLRETDAVALRIQLERRGFKNIGSEIVRECIRLVAARNRFDSAILWARGLKWDGVPRAATFLSDYFGVPDSPYAQAVGMYLWSALAGRAVQPAVKVDMVPVFISHQGTGKTSMVEALAPEDDAFVEVNLEHRDDNLARSLRGKLVAELAELRGLATRDAEGIKAWITRRHEEWIPKYQEFAVRYPRRMVLIGTGNNNEFLDDETGERRWLPVTVGTVNWQELRAARDQLWAEGVALFDANGVHWRDAQELATEVHAKYKVSDSWTDTIAEWLKRDSMDGFDGPKRGDNPIAMVDVLTSAIGLSVQKITRREELRAGKVLRALGYEKRTTRHGSLTFKRWVKSDEAEDKARRSIELDTFA